MGAGLILTGAASAASLAGVAAAGEVQRRAA